MAKVTILFGVMLIVFGAATFVLTGGQHPTALIPAYFGLVLAWAGVLALAQPAKKMLWMHLAASVGLVGFLFPAAMVVVEKVKAHGGPLARPAAVNAQAEMAGMCLIFVVLCVRSFIAARRSRGVETAA
jgi:hypothetical protein